MPSVCCVPAAGVRERGGGFGAAGAEENTELLETDRKKGVKRLKLQIIEELTGAINAGDQERAASLAKRLVAVNKDPLRKSLRKCSCHAAFYCSKACQRVDWPSHKTSNCHVDGPAATFMVRGCFLDTPTQIHTVDLKEICESFDAGVLCKDSELYTQKLCPIKVGHQ